MLKQEKNKIAMQIMAESLLETHLTGKFQIINIQCWFNYEQIPPILFQNKFTLEKCDVLLISS